MLQRMNELIRGLGWVGVVAAATGLWEPAHGADAAVEFKVATVAPPDTSFHRHFQDLGVEWRKAPGGGVALNIFPGTQGGEPTIVRRMQLKQLQGAMLTAVGLAQIDESVTALQLMPLLFRSWAEVDHARDALAPQLEQRFLTKGYVVLFWADAGWVRFFSKRPINSVADLRAMRVFASSGTPKAVELMKEYYNPILLEPDKILLSLRNGMIDTVPIPPFLANFTQVATEANHMLDMKWAPVVGAMVVTKAAWDRLPAETQAHLRQTALAAGEKIRAGSRHDDDEAIRAMREKQGLKVTPLSSAAEAGWRAEVERNQARIRGVIVPAEMFDAVQAAVNQHRAAGK
jgi:TRAP-type C4-dicarboxylate transport system substrate-binding protein